MDPDQVTGIVLSGGKSSRMGQDKGLCMFRGKPLIEYVVDVISPFCGEIIIGANQDSYQRFDHRVVPDRIEGIGPAGGILSCLSASNSEHNLVVSCDIPMISQGLIGHIFSSVQNFDAVIPIYKNQVEPMCAYYNHRVVDHFEKSVGQGQYKLQDIIKGINTRYVHIHDQLGFYTEHLFYNVNTISDLELLEKQFSKK